MNLNGYERTGLCHGGGRRPWSWHCCRCGGSAEGAGFWLLRFRSSVLLAWSFFVICEIDAGSIGLLLLIGLVKSMPDLFSSSFVASYPTEHTRDKIRIDYVTVRG